MSDPSIPKRHELAATALTLFADRVTVEVVSAFDRQGIRSILLKGPATAELLGGSGAHLYGDTDLLVSPETLPAAEDTLKSLGFAGPRTDFRGDRRRHADAWSRPGDGAGVDLHHTLPAVTASPRVVWELLSERTETLHVGELSVPVLTTPARALHLAMHTGQHGPTGAQKRPILVLERALSIVPDDVWEEAARLADSMGAMALFASGLNLAPGGLQLAERLRIPASTSRYVALRAFKAPSPAFSLDWLASIDGSWAKAAYVARKLFPPAEYLRRASSLARFGIPGLVAAYVWRVPSLLWRLGTGLPAFWRASRAARGKRTSYR